MIPVYPFAFPLLTQYFIFSAKTPSFSYNPTDIYIKDNNSRRKANRPGLRQLFRPQFRWLPERGRQLGKGRKKGKQHMRYPE